MRLVIYYTQSALCQEVEAGVPLLQCVQMCVCVCVCACVCACVPVCVHVHVCVHACEYASILPYILYMSALVHIYMYTLHA